MKQALSVLLAVMLCLSVFSGCNASKQPTRNVVELTTENLWKYIAVSQTTSFVKAESDEALECSVRGVLDYALYEDVVMIFEILYYEPGAYGENIKSAAISISLNAAGDADFAVPYHGLPLIQNGKGYVNPTEPVIELYGFNRSISLKSVTGKVVYTA